MIFYIVWRRAGCWHQLIIRPTASTRLLYTTTYSDLKYSTWHTSVYVHEWALPTVYKRAGSGAVAAEDKIRNNEIINSPFSILLLIRNSNIRNTAQHWRLIMFWSSPEIRVSYVRALYCSCMIVQDFWYIKQFVRRRRPGSSEVTS